MASQSGPREQIWRYQGILKTWILCIFIVFLEHQAAQRPPRQPRSVPRWLQAASKSLSNKKFHLWIDLLNIAPRNGSKRCPKSAKNKSENSKQFLNKCYLWAPKRCLKLLKMVVSGYGHFRTGVSRELLASRSPQMSQDGPKIALHGPKMTQNGPKIGRDGPKWPRDAPKWSQHAPRCFQNAPRCLQVFLFLSNGGGVLDPIRPLRAL